MSSTHNGQPPERELVLCHGCENEWWRDEHGLQCPQCQCDIVEIISPNDDPRNDRLEPPETQPSSPRSPHNGEPPPRPWAQNEAPDPDQEDIDHVAFSPAPGIHFQRTFIRTGTVRNGQRQPNDDVVGSLFQAFGGLMQGAQNPNRQGNQPNVRGFMIGHPPPHFASQNPMQPPAHHHHFHSTWPPNAANGPPRNPWNAEERAFPPNMPRGNPADPMTGIHAMMSTLMASMQPNVQNGGPPNMRREGNGGPVGPGFNIPELLSSIFNPANAVHGDAAYTQEAFDRILSQMMEQNNGSSAPGPASEAAISALPKKKVDKTMLGSDGKAECSVCMDNVSPGDEVTVLPCNHWFHEMCVTIWLKEHDTCPHCRKGIMPAEGEQNAPRSPGQPPRHSQNPFDRPPPPTPGAGPGSPHMQRPFMQPGMNQPYVPGGYPAYPEPQSFVQPPPPMPPRPEGLQPGSSGRSSRHGSTSSRGGDRRNSTNGQNSGGGGGVTGWLRNLRGSSRNGDS